MSTYLRGVWLYQVLPKETKVAEKIVLLFFQAEHSKRSQLAVGHSPGYPIEHSEHFKQLVKTPSIGRKAKKDQKSPEKQQKNLPKPFKPW